MDKPTTSTTTQTFIAMSPNYWGKGESVEEAKKELKKAGGTLTKYLVFQLPPGAEDAFVDQMGTVRWTWAEGADRTQQCVIVAKRGTSK
jgi:hypothetical protein